MFITPHTSVALWISTKVTDPFLAFILGLISHFVLDIIPHGDDNLSEHLSGRARFIYEMKIATADTIVAGALILFFLFYGPPVNHWVLFWVIFGSWLPDMTWILVETLKINVLYWYVVYHAKLHNFFGWQYSPVYGVPFQILFTLLVVRIVF